MTDHHHSAEPRFDDGRPVGNMPIAGSEWVLVPREPTLAMLIAVDDQDSDKYVARGRAIEAWSAMLAAAPRAPSAGDEARAREVLAEHVPPTMSKSPVAWPETTDAIIAAMLAFAGLVFVGRAAVYDSTAFRKIILTDTGADRKVGRTQKEPENA